MSNQVPPISIIVPTFREADNIEPLVSRITEALQCAGVTAEIIVVDDDSADGTDEVIKRLAEIYPVQLIVRKGKRGLASAVLDGFAQARHDVFVVMDADLQHDPAVIPHLVEPIARNHADIVFGSRYSERGGIAEQWGLWRRLNSRVATALAKPLVSLTDPMSGFFALSRNTWENAAPLHPVGYKIGLELAVKSQRPRIVETPIMFAERRAGKSKLSTTERVRYLWHLARLYWFRYPVWLALTLLVIALGIALAWLA